VLDERQIKCCELIAKGTPVIDIPKEIQVARSTIYEWKKLEEFNAEVDRLQQEFVSAAQGRLKCAAKDAADQVIDLLTKGKYEKTRLAAAIDILDRNLGKATTKIDINNDKTDANKVSDDILENEFNEIDGNEV
jgi:hypothetical protein